MNKIAAMLDAVADSLENKGLVKEAYEVDKIADAVESNVHPYGGHGGQLPSESEEDRRRRHQVHRDPEDPGPKGLGYWPSGEEVQPGIDALNYYRSQGGLGR